MNHRKKIYIINDKINQYLNYDLITKFKNQKESNNIFFSKNNLDIVSDSNINDESKYYEHLIQYIKKALDRNEQIQLFSNLGEAFEYIGFFKLAVISYNHILKLAKNNKKYLSIYANSLYGLGGIYSEQDLWKLSIGYMSQARKIFINLKDKNGILRCDNSLGIIFARRGNMKKAMFYFQKCINNSDNEKDIKWIAKYENNLGNINRVLGNYDLAFYLYNNAIIKSERAKDFYQLIQSKSNLAYLYLENKHYKNAMSEFDLCLSISLKNNFHIPVGQAFAGKCLIFYALNDENLAMKYLDKSFEYFNRTNYLQGIEYLIRIKGMIKRKQKKYKSAEKYFIKSNKINYSIQSWANIALNNYELGILYNEKQQKQKALEYFLKSLKYYNKMNISHMVKKIETQINEIVD